MKEFLFSGNLSGSNLFACFMKTAVGVWVKGWGRVRVAVGEPDLKEQRIILVFAKFSKPEVVNKRSVLRYTADDIINIDNERERMKICVNDIVFYKFEIAISF